MLKRTTPKIFGRATPALPLRCARGRYAVAGSVITRRRTNEGKFLWLAIPVAGNRYVTRDTQGKGSICIAHRVTVAQVEDIAA